MDPSVRYSTVSRSRGLGISLNYFVSGDNDDSMNFSLTHNHNGAESFPFVKQGAGSPLPRPWGPLRERKCSQPRDRGRDFVLLVSIHSFTTSLGRDSRCSLLSSPLAIAKKKKKKRWQGAVRETVSFQNYARPFRAFRTHTRRSEVAWRAPANGCCVRRKWIRGDILERHPYVWF